MDQSSFWEDPGRGNDTPVIRHSPDAASYQLPDSRMLERMPFGKVGAFAVVPSARPDGTSLAFDIDAGVVHVDPDAPDGGRIVDLSRASAPALDSAISQSRYPHQVFYKLGVSPSEYAQGAVPAPVVAQPRANPMLPPGGYVVPSQHVQELTQMQPLTPLGPTTQPVAGLIPLKETYSYPPQTHPQPPQAQPAQAQPAQAQPAQPYYPPWPYYPPQQPAFDHGQLTEIMGQLVAGIQQISRRLDDRQAPSPVQAPAPLATLPAAFQRPPGDTFGEPRTAESFARKRDEDREAPRANSMVEAERRAKQTVAELERHEAEPSGVIIGFERLNIPFVSGPLPQKPERTAIFNFPGNGQQQARFHGIEEYPECVVLVYDTRYDLGVQFLPPDLDDQKITLHVPHLKKRFEVASMGLNFALGVLDFIVLVKSGSADEPGF